MRQIYQVGIILRKLKKKVIAFWHQERYNSSCINCRCSSSVERQLPKLERRVRLPSSASNRPRVLENISPLGLFLFKESE